MLKRFPELGRNEQRGSKPRCHLLTDGTRAEVAGRLTGLVKPFGSVSKGYVWRPRGFERTDELQLHIQNRVIPLKVSRELQRWWFAVRGGASPNWDIVSQCSVGKGKDSKDGVLLVEAKAHSAELDSDAKSPAGASDGSQRNHKRIGDAIDEANVGLQRLTGNAGWSLSRDHCYQISNRFAWAWKIAELGVPVVLVYLGFLDASEMSDKGDTFADPEGWDRCVKVHAKGQVPEDVWEQPFQTSSGVSLIARIVAVRQALGAARMPA